MSLRMKYGIGGILNEKKSKKLCIKSSEMGNETAKAMRIYFGWNKKKKPEKAVKIFKKMIEKDEKFKKKETQFCLFFVARSYQLGEGAVRDLLHAKSLYKKAVALGNPCAMNNLAYIYEKENPTPKSIKKSIRLYQRSYFNLI